MNDPVRQLEVLRKATAVLTIANVRLVKGAVKQATATAMYLAAKGADDEARKVATWRLDLQRAAGMLLQGMPKQTGGDAMRARSQPATEVPASLAAQGIDKHDAATWQRLAEIPDEEYEAYKADAPEVTTAGALRVAKKASPSETPELMDGTYRVIYADPPWLYSSMQHSKEEQETTLDTHYKQMPTEALADLPVKKWLPSDAVLFLWTTSPKLYEAGEVIDGWGFDYKASIIWDKVKHNVGYYVSVRHEFLLICTRGSCLPDAKKLEDSVVSIERTQHSAKPSYFREWIDRMYLPPEGRIDRIEMFPRGEIPEHWARWGGEP